MAAAKKLISQKESLIIVNKSAFLCHKSANRCPFLDPRKLDSFSAKLFITKQSELNEFLTTLVIKIKKINWWPRPISYQRGIETASLQTGCTYICRHLPLLGLSYFLKIWHVWVTGVLFHYILHKNNIKIRHTSLSVVISQNNNGSLEQQADLVIIKQTFCSRAVFTNRFISRARVFVRKTMSQTCNKF